MDHLLKINNIIKQYEWENGTTEPILCDLSDNTRAVVKYPNNPEGNLILFNEFVGYEIAKAINLPTPQCGVCQLDSSSCFSINNHIINENNFGKCFYSTFLESSIPLKSENIFCKIENAIDFYNMIVFDHIVYNIDRHPGNILVCLKKPIKFYTIDNSHIFKNQSIWDRYTFLRGMETNDYCDEKICDFNKDTYGSFFRFQVFDRSILLHYIRAAQDVLTDEKIHTIIASTPQEWILVKEDVMMLEKYLNYRISHLEHIIEIVERRSKDA